MSTAEFQSAAQATSASSPVFPSGSHGWMKPAEVQGSEAHTTGLKGTQRARESAGRDSVKTSYRWPCGSSDLKLCLALWVFRPEAVYPALPSPSAQTCQLRLSHLSLQVNGVLNERHRLSVV